jgi:hypothetical protein
MLSIKYLNRKNSANSQKNKRQEAKCFHYAKVTSELFDETAIHL